MKSYHLGMIVVLGISILGGPSSVAAGEQKLTGTFTGSLISSPIDTNSDGIPAVLSSGRGKTNLGLALFQTLGESASFLPVVKQCPQGNMEFPLLMGYGAAHFDDSGDQLIVKYTTGVTCFDPQTRKLTSTATGVFAGGTGKFAEASGSVESVSTLSILVVDPAHHVFDVFSGQVTGTIITP